MNNRRFPFPEPDKNDLKYVCPSASWSDMTGLIPTGPENHIELDFYEEMYPFLPRPETDSED